MSRSRKAKRVNEIYKLCSYGVHTICFALEQQPSNVCFKHKLWGMLKEKLVLQTIQTATTKDHTLKTACMSHVPSIPSAESSMLSYCIYLL